MSGFWLLSVCLLALAACQGADNEPAAELRSDQAQPAAATPSPEQAYREVCAGCHEEGRDGAPRTNHPEDWQGRSQLWQAVLVEHAKSGYLNMPAKGGEPSLADRTVAAAAEYMLEITYKNIPPDN
jgi:cytochrome c5